MIRDKFGVSGDTAGNTAGVGRSGLAYLIGIIRSESRSLHAGKGIVFIFLRDRRGDLHEDQ